MEALGSFLFRLAWGDGMSDLAKHIASKYYNARQRTHDIELWEIIEDELEPIMKVVEASEAWLDDRGQPDSPENYRPATKNLMQAIIDYRATKPKPPQKCIQCGGRGCIKRLDSTSQLCPCILARIEKLEAGK